MDTDVIDKQNKLIEWNLAARPIAGQTGSGDLHVVEIIDRGALLAVIDGVGHGDEAGEAAKTAADILKKHARESVISMVKRCHEALAGTRGVVLTLAALDSVENTMTWIGVGNVEARLFRAEANVSHPNESILLRGGLLGLQLPALKASIMPIAPADLLVLATDGIRPDFDQTVTLTETPKQIADRILNQHFKGTDDALVLVARYLGKQHE